MTSIEQAIRESGWYFDGNYWLREGDAKAYTISDILLTPLFWQALGKARGWPQEVGGNITIVNKNISGWKVNWHHFSEHLASGKDEESFFATL